MLTSISAWLTLALGESVSPASATYCVRLAMQVLVRVHTHQRASQAYDAQIPAIKLIHEMQTCRGHTRGIAETLQITAASQTKTPHSSRAGEGSGRVRIILYYFFIIFHAINRNTRLAVFHLSCGVEGKQGSFAQK
jgi:hypothetical protein